MLGSFTEVFSLQVYSAGLLTIAFSGKTQSQQMSLLLFLSLCPAQEGCKTPRGDLHIKRTGVLS